MGFSYLFILQLRSWPHSLGPPDSDSGPLWFSDLWPPDLRLSASASAGLWPPISASTSFGPHRPSEAMQLHRDRSWAAITHQYLARPTPTSTFCKADTYQYLLQSRHLLVPFAKPTPTSIHCKAIIYQYPMVQDDSSSIIRGADFSIV